MYYVLLLLGLWVEDKSLQIEIVWSSIEEEEVQNFVVLTRCAMDFLSFTCLGIVVGLNMSRMEG